MQTNTILKTLLILLSFTPGCAVSDNSLPDGYCDLYAGECGGHARAGDAQDLLSSMNISESNATAILALDPATDLGWIDGETIDSDELARSSCNGNGICVACCYWDSSGETDWHCSVLCL